MIPFDQNKPRRVIPRWRSFHATAISRELAGPPGPSRLLDVGARLDNKISEWGERPSIETATTLVESVAVLGKAPDAAIQAATFLVAPSSTATPHVKRLARAALGGFQAGFDLGETDARTTIQICRRRIRLNPRDALRWIDLARAYSAIGLNKKALRATEIALQLAPNNRFVVRSAARFFVHNDDPDFAHKLLLRTSATPHDPWLNATEIATASLIGRAPRFMRAARSFLEASDFRALDLAELAGAMGTLEIENGKNVQAKRLFRQSLLEPNDNALAQASWAAQRHRVGNVDPSLLESTPFSFEAKTLNAFWKGDWETSLEQSTFWAMDEPFSAGPACHGSFVAISVLGKNEEGERIALAGLRANPNEVVLKNNLLVSYAFQNRIQDAERIFYEIHWPKELEQNKHAALGLISARKGDFVSSHFHYMSAMEIAIENGDSEGWGRAAFYFFLELIRFHPSAGARTLKLAEKILEHQNSIEFRAYRERMKQEVQISSTSNLFPVDDELSGTWFETMISTMESTIERRERRKTR